MKLPTKVWVKAMYFQHPSGCDLVHVAYFNETEGATPYVLESQIKKEKQMEKTVKVMVWKTDGSDQSPAYRLDDKDAGFRFFADIEANAEMDGRESFVLEMWSEEEWAEAERIGAEMA
jgi:hypothetical protein